MKKSLLAVALFTACAVFADDGNKPGCEALASDAIRAIAWRAEGATVEQVKAQIPANSSDEDRATVSSIIDQAYAWEGERIEFALRVLWACNDGDIQPYNYGEKI